MEKIGRNVEGDIADTAAHFRHRCRDPFSFSN